MKLSAIIKVAALAMPLFVASCGTTKKTVSETKTTTAPTQENVTEKEFLRKVSGTSSNFQFVSSKVKFSIEVGAQRLSLTGNLRMKRDDVIRLQLMAFGFVEAGRLEFTKDYVLVVDRINKLYMKSPYNYVDFLRNTGINFYTLQALFWNELFIPGEDSVDKGKLNKFSADMGGDEVVISLDKEKGLINYSWLANGQTGRIKMANIVYRDPNSGHAQLNWDYRELSPLNRQLFPSDMDVTLTLPKKEIKCGIKLSYLDNESDWETRTTVSKKYRAVDIDEILRRFMAM